MDGVHMKPVRGIGRQAHFDRVYLAPRLPQFYFKWHIRGGGVSGVLSRVALLTSVAIPYQRPLGGEPETSFPFLESPFPPTDRYRAAV
jgi:hypothetical protein